MGILHGRHINLNRDIVEEEPSGLATDSDDSSLKRSEDIYVWLGHILPPSLSLSACLAAILSLQRVVYDQPWSYRPPTHYLSCRLSRSKIAGANELAMNSR